MQYFFLESNTWFKLGIIPDQEPLLWQVLLQHGFEKVQPNTVPSAIAYENPVSLTPGSQGVFQQVY